MNDKPKWVEHAEESLSNIYVIIQNALLISDSKLIRSSTLMKTKLQAKLDEYYAQHPEQSEH